jgi:hypothetical protein
MRDLVLIPGPRAPVSPLKAPEKLPDSRENALKLFGERADEISARRSLLLVAARHACATCCEVWVYT